MVWWGYQYIPHTCAWHVLMRGQNATSVWSGCERWWFEVPFGPLRDDVLLRGRCGIWLYYGKLNQVDISLHMDISLNVVCDPYICQIHINKCEVQYVYRYRTGRYLHLSTTTHWFFQFFAGAIFAKVSMCCKPVIDQSYNAGASFQSGGLLLGLYPLPRFQWSPGWQSLDSMKSYFRTWVLPSSLVNLSAPIFSGDGLRNCMQLQLVQSLDHATTGPRLTKKTKKGSYSGEI